MVLDRRGVWSSVLCNYYYSNCYSLTSWLISCAVQIKVIIPWLATAIPSFLSNWEYCFFSLNEIFIHCGTTPRGLLLKAIWIQYTNGSGEMTFSKISCLNRKQCNHKMKPQSSDLPIWNPIPALIDNRVSTICNVTTNQTSKFDVIFFVDCWNCILYISRVYFGEVRFKELGEGK